MLRLGSGLDIEPDAVELPVSPRTICSAYRQSLENIADVHHILGRTETARNPLVTDNIEASGVDYIERHSAVALSPSEFLTYFGDSSHINS